MNIKAIPPPGGSIYRSALSTADVHINQWLLHVFPHSEIIHVGFLPWSYNWARMCYVTHFPQ